MMDMGEREHRYVVALAACHVPAIALYPGEYVYYR